MTRQGEPDDDGSILLLVLGVVVVLAMLLALIVDTGRLYLERRSLDSVTDAAALAGAQAVDLDAVYSGAARRDLVLDEGEATRAVSRHLSAADVERGFAAFAVTDVEVDGTEVTVETSAVVRLPFAGPLLGDRGSVTLRSTATARNRIVAD